MEYNTQLLRHETSLAVLLRTLGTIPLLYLLWSVYIHFTSPLRKYPGPWIAGWTNLWRLYLVWRREPHTVVRKLHQKYGPVVRIGPNMLDLDLPGYIKTVYNIKGDWRKTEFYDPSSARVDGKVVPNLFSDSDSKRHAQRKRPVASFYSMNSVLTLEPQIDKAIELLCEQLQNRFVDRQQICNLADWISFYAWDVVGTVTFSEPWGYLEKGCDFDGMLDISDRSSDYLAIVGQLPILDHFLDKNPIRPMGPPSSQPLVDATIRRMIARLRGNDEAHHQVEKPDYLDQFIEAKKAYPDIVDDNQLVSYLMINTIAGADTTSITIKSAFYFALKNRPVWKKVCEEVRSRIPTNDGQLSFRAARDLPYLEAVIRESMRMHPGIQMPLERYTPQEGARLPNGDFLPPGIIIGMNPYIISRNVEVWGDDVDVYRPERWLRGSDETEESYKKRLGMMNNSDLGFGAGSRICLGRHLAVMQVYKVVAALIMKYDIELADPGKDWEVTHSWFVRQKGLDVKLSPRI